MKAILTLLFLQLPPTLTVQLVLFFVSVFTHLTVPGVVTAQLCLYTTPEGSVKQVNSINEIPVGLRSKARCFAAKTTPTPEQPSTPPRATVSLQPTPQLSPPSRPPAGALAAPEEIALDGNIRREYLSSPLGKIDLRWPRKVETIFGRTPSRAMADAARTVSKTLTKPAFPPELQRLNLEWKVVFMDADLPETQIPQHLIANCHPGWMTPPSNIYIVAQRVAAGCSGQSVSQSVADSRLAEVLVHEIGHAIEFQLLKESFGSDRMRAEGWATWFTEFAADNSALMNRRDTIELNNTLAKRAIAASPWGFHFSGSAEDYARAGMFFRAIVESRNLETLIEIYKLIRHNRKSFFEAVQARTSWSTEQLNREVLKMLKVKTEP